MGKVMTKVKLTNHADRLNARQGLIPIEAVRSVELDALVDTGATMFALPEDVRQRLGLAIEGTRKVRYANGQAEEIPWVGAVLIEILAREMSGGALVLPAGATALIGQLQLEELDLIVDAKSRDVRVNPASPDMPLLDLLAVA